MTLHKFSLDKEIVFATMSVPNRSLEGKRMKFHRKRVIVLL
jgi:hypothetical protein